MLSKFNTRVEESIGQIWRWAPNSTLTGHAVTYLTVLLRKNAIFEGWLEFTPGTADEFSVGSLAKFNDSYCDSSRVLEEIS